MPKCPSCGRTFRSKVGLSIHKRFCPLNLHRDREISLLYARGEKTGDLARRFGLSRERIRQIVRARRRSRKLTEEEIRELASRAWGGYYIKGRD